MNIVKSGADCFVLESFGNFAIVSKEQKCHGGKSHYKGLNN